MSFEERQVSLPLGLDTLAYRDIGMVTFSPSTSGLVCDAWDSTSPIRSPTPITEPGRFENVETEWGRGCDGVYGIFYRDVPCFFCRNVDPVVETWMGTWSNSELARPRGMGREIRRFRRLTFASQGRAE